MLALKSGLRFFRHSKCHFWHLKMGTFAKTSKFEFDQNKNPSILTGVGDHVANHESSWSAWRRSGSWYFVILILNFSKYSLALIFTKAYHLESYVQSKHLKWNLREGNIEMGVRGNFLSRMVKEFLTQPLTGGQRTKLTWILAAVGCQNFWYKPNLWLFSWYVSGWYLTFGFWAMLHEPVHFVVLLSFSHLIASFLKLSIDIKKSI